MKTTIKKNNNERLYNDERHRVLSSGVYNGEERRRDRSIAKTTLGQWCDKNGIHSKRDIHNNNNNNK
ncbi:hypothetical protein BLOT_003550 [Blomia tropicalis]|nr:hypothetical protein BLOT_003550 [Blomia tropicalis]